MTTTLMAASACTAALCAGGVAWLTVGQELGLRRARLLIADGAAVESAAPGAPPWERWLPRARVWARRARGEWLCLPVAVVLAVLGESVLPLVGGALAVPLVRRRLKARETRRVRERRADGIVALCGAAAAELRVKPPARTGPAGRCGGHRWPWRRGGRRTGRGAVRW